MEHHKIAGCLFGAALGDALAAPTEFMNMDEIQARYGDQGPDLIGSPAKVTDDTQMMLAVGHALLEAGTPPVFEAVEDQLRKHFVTWLHDPENNRAPGMTCLRACENLERGIPWQEATIYGSKGCGANMRVQPAGLIAYSDREMAGIAQFQAALTHGHPTALAASELTALAIRKLADGLSPEQLPGLLIDHAIAQQQIYHENWLGNLWQRPGEISSKHFIHRGWSECFEVLKRLRKALQQPDRSSNPCLACGEGWIAEEALATGLFCFLLYPDQPVKALTRAARTSGDSDSIACLTGSFAGACLGLEAWPESWLQRIEYKDELNHMAKEMARL